MEGMIGEGQMPLIHKSCGYRLSLAAGHPVSLQESDAVTLPQGPMGSFKSPSGDTV